MQRLDAPQTPRARITLALLTGVLLIGAGGLTYATGGTSHAYLHVIYIPVFLCGAIFGVAGGVLGGLAAGLILGPWMPLDVVAGTLQEPASWLARAAFLVAAGIVAGAFRALMDTQQERLRWFVHHSAATGLPNRHALIRALEQVAEEGSNAPARHTLVLIQINNFEQLMSGLGAQIGDRTLLALAQRLQSRQLDILGVFDLRAYKLAVLLSDAKDAVGRYIRQVHQIPENAMLVDGIPVYADLTLGSVTLDEPQRPPEEWLQDANIALNHAVHHGRLHTRYDRQLESTRRRELELLARLPQALRVPELFIEYQPKVALSDGSTVGAEALVRWRHPKLGRVPPGDFVPLAEQTALIHPLTRWIMATALDQCCVHRRDGHELHVAINLSPRNLEDPDLFSYLAGLLAAKGLPATCVELEITETAVLEGSSRLESALTALRESGMKVSIDDFGTGYTSLHHLADLPVDSLKIDQSFIRPLMEDERRREIVRAMIGMAKNLGLTTVAEGVETREVAEALREMGCDVGQGYYFSRPLRATALEAWLGT